MLKTAIDNTGVGKDQNPGVSNYAQFAFWFEDNADELADIDAGDMPQYEGTSLLLVLYDTAIDKANEPQKRASNSTEEITEANKTWSGVTNKLYLVCHDLGVPLS